MDPNGRKTLAAGAAACSRDSYLVPSQETIDKTMAISKQFTGQSRGVLELSAWMRELDMEDDSYRN